MPFKLKKGWLIAISILLAFMLLNPTYSDFKDFTGHHTEDSEVKLIREKNFLLFSVYYLSENNGGIEQRYIAFLKNFIQIS